MQEITGLASAYSPMGWLYHLTALMLLDRAHEALFLLQERAIQMEKHCQFI